MLSMYLGDIFIKNWGKSCNKIGEKLSRVFVGSSKICSEKDITNRCNKANVAYYTYKNLWPNKAPDSVDLFQRKNLRQILKIFWPNVISNENLYKRCKVRPLTERIAETTKMLRHVLRRGESLPIIQICLFNV